VASGHLGSIVLYGPSGIGKTTIARAIGAEMGKVFRELHPSNAGVDDFRAIASEAEAKDVLVFADEAHRFNKATTDRLLGMTEEGLFDLVMATTENPFFALTPALVSRSTIFTLHPLSVEDTEEVVKRAVVYLASKGVSLRIAPEDIRKIAGRAGGDARRAINVVEGLSRGLQAGETHEVTLEQIDAIYQASPVPYDRSGDAHYDVISAFIKSMRGSDPDATLYWLARLLHSGEDPRFVARRILIHASEDVGLADNTALSTAAAALTAVQHVGMPEAQHILAHAALHIARAPKSNSASRGISLAMDHVRTQPLVEVPPHLRDAHYAGAAELGVGGYRFPHDDPRGWLSQDYAPGIARGLFYQSDARGGATFEQRADDFWDNVTGAGTPRRFERP
jgi:putative ATPase